MAEAIAARLEARTCGNWVHLVDPGGMFAAAFRKDVDLAPPSGIAAEIATIFAAQDAYWIDQARDKFAARLIHLGNLEN